MSTPDIRLTAGQLARLVGVGQSTILDWDREGLLRPSRWAEVRPNVPARIYSFADLCAARIAIELRARGIDLRALRSMIHYLQRRGVQDREERPYVVISGDRAWSCGADATFATVGDAEAIILDIRGVIARIETALDQVIARQRELDASRQAAVASGSDSTTTDAT